MYGVEYGVDTIQHLIFEELVVIDNVCKKNNIKYSLHGGTLLGAIREKGFIPWDDDGDISMSRAEFNRFAKIFDSSQDSYEITYSEGWVFRVSPRKESGIDERACVDVFIFDYISENTLAQKCKIYLLRMLQGMLKPNIDLEQYHGMGRVMTNITFHVGKLFSRERKLKWYGHISEFWFLGKKNLVHRTDDTYKALELIHPSYILDSHTQAEFEGKEFPIISEYKQVLAAIYGDDYMTPPSEDKRVPVHGMKQD